MGERETATKHHVRVRVQVSGRGAERERVIKHEKTMRGGGRRGGSLRQDGGIVPSRQGRDEDEREERQPSIQRIYILDR